MSRPVDTKLSRRNGSQHQQLDRPGLYAPATTHVGGGSAAGHKAEALARAFGVGMQGFSGIAHGKIEAQAIQDGKSFREGAIDARAGAADDERRRTDDSYARAAEQVEAKALLAEDEVELRTAAEEFVNSGDVTGLDGLIKTEYEKRWAGVDQNQAQIVAPHWDKMRENLLKEARDQAQILTDNKNYANVLTTARGEYLRASSEGREFDFATLHGEIRSLFGKRANEVTTRVLLDLMETNEDPDLFDKIPETVGDGVPSVKKTPGFREKLLDGQTSALRAREATERRQREVGTFQRLNSYNERIDTGSWVSEGEVQKDVEDQYLTAAQGASILERQRAAQDRRSNDEAVYADLSQRFADNSIWTVKGVVPDAVVNAAFDRWIGEHISEMSPTDAMRFIGEHSQGNDLVFRPFKAKLSALTPESLEENLEMYRELYAVNPTAAYHYISDDTVRQQYAAAAVLQDHRMPMDAVARLVMDGDPKNAMRWTEGSMRVDFQAALRKQKFDRPDGFFNARFVRAENKAWVHSEYLRLADALGSVGTFASNEDLFKAVDKVFEGNYVALGNMVVEVNDDIQGDTPAAWKWFHETHLATELEGTGADPEDAVLLTDGRYSNDRISFGLYHRDTHEPLLPDARFTLADINAAYRTRAHEDFRNRRDRNRAAMDEALRELQYTTAP